MAQTFGFSNGAASSSSGTTFAAGGEDVLKALLQQLLGGGTPEQRAEQARRIEEINAVRQQRGDYSKEAALADSQAVSARESRLALEKLVPSISRAAEGAGTSASSMRALLLQDAAQRAAESAAALGLKASVDYGNISTGLSGVLNSLTQQNNPITKALIDALAISKGQNSTSVGDSRGAVSGGSGTGFVGGQVGLSPSQTGWAGTGLDKPFVRTPSEPNYGESITEDQWQRIHAPYSNAAYSQPISQADWNALVNLGNSNVTANRNAGNTWGGDSWGDYQF